MFSVPDEASSSETPGKETPGEEAPDGGEAERSAAEQKLVKAYSEARMVTFDQILLIDPTTDEIEQRLNGWLPQHLAFSPDGTFLGVYEKPRQFALLDADTGEPLHMIELPGESPELALSKFAFSPDSKRVAIITSGEGQPGVWVWDVASMPAASADAADKPAAEGAAVPQGDAADDKPAESPAEPVSARSVLEIHAEGPVGPIAYSPDGKMIAVGGGKGPLVIYDAQSGQPKTKITPVDEKEEALLKSLSTMGGGMGGGIGNEGFHVGVWALAFSPDSARLAVGAGAGQVKLFDAESGKFELAIGDPITKAGIEVPEELRPLMRIAHGHVSGVAFSADGKLLASDGIPAVGYNQRLWEPLRLWDAKTGKPKPGFRGEHNASTEAIAFSRDGKLLASAGRWTVGKETVPGVKLRDAATGEVLTAIPMLTGGDQDQPLSVDFSPDGRRLAVAQTRYDNRRDVTDAGIWLLEVPSGLVKFSAKVPRIYTKAAFSADGSLLAAFSGAARLTFWQTGQHMASSELAPPDPEADEQWNTLAFDPSGQRLAIAGLDADKKGLVRVWDFGATPAADKEAPPQDGK